MSELVAKAKTTTTPKIYRDFFKLYYKENSRLFLKISAVISVIAIIAGLAIYLSYKYIGCTLLVFGIVLAIYPRFSYKRPYKSVKDNKVTATFEFYEDKLSEKNSVTKGTYKYKSIPTVWETPEYFYIFHSKENVSVIDKNKFSVGSAEDVAALLKNNVKKYEVK